MTDGVLSDVSRSALHDRGLDVLARPDGSIALRGEFTGLAELNDVIFALEDFGLGLVSVHQIP
ncbi:hypothetical protein FE697_009480 [Mumia zhuanghuii]|uniref:BON domain-containing protein n=1 Tax=Mumia zhuanghuii TaxID=2585211 RepID=A0A5Q6S0B7_9ACTN|nr:MULTISPECIES: hypothetical protein [Mumia]KAA1423785.1 hypothetical protein FE697_009480 [Mumia zhuanghuii]